jgi:hypothetical protein
MCQSGPACDEIFDQLSHYHLLRKTLLDEVNSFASKLFLHRRIKTFLNERYRKLCVVKHLIDFLFRMLQNETSLLANFALEVAIGKVQEKQKELKLNGK